MVTDSLASQSRRVGLSGSAPYVVSMALVVVTVVAAAGTFFVDDLLHGTAAMNGSARGTALVMLAVATPVLVVSMVSFRRGSGRAVFGWLGATAYLVYNSFLLLFATPFNALFLVYIAGYTLGLATLAVVGARLDVPTLADRFSPRTPVRGVAIFLWVVVVLNALAWLSKILPDLDSDRPAFLVGTGLTTNPIYVQDLAIWLPLATIGALWLWQRKPLGFLVVGVLLPMYVLEAIGVATDQWFGSAADPTSTVVSSSLVLPFAILAAVTLVATFVLLRHFRPRVV